MADQIPDFVDGDTNLANRVTAAWLNDVNDHVYREYISVKRYGAAGDGVTDDTAAWTAAGATGAKFIFVPQGSYVLNTAVPILAGQTWLMAGVTILTTSSTQTILSATTVDDWALVGPFVISGNGSTIGSANGVLVTGCNRWRITDYICKTLKGTGLAIQPGTPSGSLRGDQGQIINYQALSCYIGMQNVVGAGAEYCTFTAPMIVGCGTGMNIAAGNTTVVGGNIVDNTIGVELVNGSNHGHGMFVGVNINHNATYNLRATDVTLGFDFIGCHFYEKPIQLTNCAGISLRDGHIDCAITSDTGAGAGYNYITNNYVPNVYGFSVAGTASAKLVVRGNGSDVKLLAENDAAFIYVAATRATSTQALSSGDTLIYNTEQKDNRNSYDNTTGIFTQPTGYATIQMRLEATAIITAASGLVTAGSWIEIKQNSTVRGYIPLVAVSGTVAIANGGVTVPLAAADTLSLRIILGGGVTPVFDITQSSLCIQSID